ncbi:MAG: GGDEF domain-containing protein [Mesorhizobium sp.]
MIRIALRATAVTIAAIAISVSICGFVLSSLGGRLDGVALWLCIICPLVTAWPVSAFMFSQSARLKAAHRDLARMHAQLAAAHRRLAEKACRDDMTGMLNRESFFAVLERSRRKADRGTLLIIDADHFKSINDNFGHLTGDEALLLIAAAIKRGVRAGDVLGRIGGEEFCAFLPGTDEREASQIAERIRREVEAIRFQPDGEQAIPLTVSIGGALCPQGAKIPDLMRSADRRLYEAKHSGRNLVIVETVPKAA